jgi:subtilisin-like proprotein convertase family protein
MRTSITTAGTLMAALLATLAFASGPASAASGTFDNPTPIVIPDKGVASPYPSVIHVPPMPGLVTEVTVTLRGFTHSAPGDVDILLVSPDGDASVVMSDACGLGIQNYSFVFTKNATASMPGGPPSICDGLFYRPTDYSPAIADDVWPDAPPGIHFSDFNEFIAGKPTGDWKLYVLDDTAGSSGKINLGWALSVETVLPDTFVPADTTGAAYPYPATRTVSGLSGVVSDLNVTVDGVYHRRPGDLHLILVGPGGQRVKLMSNACRYSAVAGARWTWDDQAPQDMQDVGACSSGSYKPTGLDSSPPLPAPAPGGPYDSSLSQAFNGTEPNGEWRLYAYDDQPREKNGFFVNRFALDITTRPRAKASLLDSAIEVDEGQTRELTLSRSSPAGGGLGPASVTVTSTPQTATSGVDYKPVATTVQFARGETQKTIPVQALTDADVEGPETFTLSLSAPTGDLDPQPPTSVVTIRDVPPAAGQGTANTASGDGASAENNQGGGPVVDRDAPRIGNVRVTRKAISYTLSEPASVTLQVRRTRRTRSVAAGSLPGTGRAGLNRVPFRGRIGGRALRAGRYRLVVSAVDPAGNRAASAPRSFRITRTPRQGTR